MSIAAEANPTALSACRLAFVAWLVARGIYTADADSVDPFNATPAKEWNEFAAWWSAIGGSVPSIIPVKVIIEPSDLCDCGHPVSYHHRVGNHDPSNTDVRCGWDPPHSNMRCACTQVTTTGARRDQVIPRTS